MSDVSLAANNSLGVDLAEGRGGYFNPQDRSGPYAVASDGTVTLLAGSDRRQLGYAQITGLGTPQGLSPPLGATRATVAAEGAAVRYRTDGTAPTTSIGMPVVAGGTIILSGSAMAAVQFVEQAAGAVLDVLYEG